MSSFHSVSFIAPVASATIASCFACVGNTFTGSNVTITFASIMIFSNSGLLFQAYLLAYFLKFRPTFSGLLTSLLSQIQA